MKSDFSAYNRASMVDSLQEEVFDLVIVGGGINGAGIARDAALRGMSVALVERSDFASGTSSRSSKLVHGGIRYLENYEFHLVFEALNERRVLYELAPHLVHPLRFVMPIYQGFRYSMNFVGLGMMFYDGLALFDVPKMHERWSVEQSMDNVPQLQAQGLQGSFVYSDAYMDDDRLVHATMRSAVNAGAVCVNYVSAGKARMDQQQIQSVECIDELSGAEFSIRGRHFVSCVGPWTDELRSSWFSEPDAILRPTKGVHITLPRERFPLKDAVVMNESNRIVFAIPRHEMVVIGTTDTDYPEDPGQVQAHAEDIRYLLNVTQEYFPGAKIGVDDIVAAYAGVRPLVKDDSESESKTSREHSIWTDDRGVTFVAGGKYTTYRLIAEQAVDEVLCSFSQEDQVKFGSSRSKTALLPKGDVDNFQRAQILVAEWSLRYGRGRDEVQFLVDRHGFEAQELLENAEANFNVWQIEAMAAIHQSFCMNLTDFYWRRVPLFLSETDHGEQWISSVASVFQRELGWSESHRAEQIESLREKIRHELAWKSEFSI